MQVKSLINKCALCSFVKITIFTFSSYYLSFLCYSQPRGQWGWGVVLGSRTESRIKIDVYACIYMYMYTHTHTDRQTDRHTHTRTHFYFYIDIYIYISAGRSLFFRLLSQAQNLSPMKNGTMNPAFKVRRHPLNGVRNPHRESD